MKDFNKEFCFVMHKFVSERINELKRPASSMSDTWKSEKDMLNAIKNNVNDAGWALCELCYWGLSVNYTRRCFLLDEYEDEDELEVKIYWFADRDGRDRYFKIDEPNEWMPIEVQKVTKMVEVTLWEETSKQ